MSDILTPAQIADCGDLDGLKRTEVEQLVWHLCASHEALRATVARLEQEKELANRERDGARAWVILNTRHRETSGCPKGGYRWEDGDEAVCSCGLRHFMTPVSDWKARALTAEAELASLRDPQEPRT